LPVGKVFLIGPPPCANAGWRGPSRARQTGVCGSCRS
jgi:hypothetical protein